MSSITKINQNQDTNFGNIPEIFNSELQISKDLQQIVMSYLTESERNEIANYYSNFFKALEEEVAKKYKIGLFTPITFSMDACAVRNAVVRVLKDIEQNPNNLFPIQNIVSCRTFTEGQRGHNLVTLANGEQWIGKCGLDRFFGARYLQEVIRDMELSRIGVTSKKIARDPNAPIKVTVEHTPTGLRTLNSKCYHVFSKLVPHGISENEVFRPEYVEYRHDRARLRGFEQWDCHFRRGDDGKYYAIDTEFGSFVNMRPAILTDEENANYSGATAPKLRFTISPSELF